MVEAALVLPLFIAILIGIMEFGYFTNQKLRIANAAREGARYAALGKTTGLIRQRVRDYAAPFTVTDAQISLTYDPTLYSTAAGSTTPPASFSTAVGDSGTENTVPAGRLIQVRVAVPYASLTRFFPMLNSQNVTASVVMRRE
jgi:Flp pilus assembly protein TadG